VKTKGWIRDLLVVLIEGIVPASFGLLVLNALNVSFPIGWGVLELLVAVVAVIFPRWHPHTHSTTTIAFTLNKSTNPTAF